MHFILENKMILCTLSDKNYLVNGLALYESLKGKFELYYLCLDDYTYNIVKQVERINVIHLNDLSGSYLDTLIQNHESRPIDKSDGQSPFHWNLAPLFTDYILNELNREECLYIDSDILFYKDLSIIEDSVKNYDIGLITHKHVKLEKSKKNVGYYNVGIIYFRNTDVGSRCCRWWTKVAIDKTNPWFYPFGSCGDQKYLELFDEIFPDAKIKIIDKDVGHLAPWNLEPAKIKNGKAIWDAQFVIKEKSYIEQPFVFYHFSHFTPDFENDSWNHQRGNEWGNIVDTEEKHKIYQDYFSVLKNIKRKYQL